MQAKVANKFEIVKGKGTYHVSGLEAATVGGGVDMGSHVSYYAITACPALTRLGGWYARIEGSDEIVEIAAKFESYGKFGKSCKHCAAALARLS